MLPLSMLDDTPDACVVEACELRWYSDDHHYSAYRRPARYGVGTLHTGRTAPLASRSTGWQPRSRRRGGPKGPLEHTYDEEVSDMAPHNYGCTAQLSASPDRIKPGPITTVFSGRRIVHNGNVSVRRNCGTHHRAGVGQIFSSRSEQNHPRTSSVRGISDRSDIFYISSNCQYWGRRRYGPARQAFCLA